MAQQRTISLLDEDFYGTFAGGVAGQIITYNVNAISAGDVGSSVVYVIATGTYSTTLPCDFDIYGDGVLMGRATINSTGQVCQLIFTGIIPTTIELVSVTNIKIDFWLRLFKSNTNIGGGSAKKRKIILTNMF